MVEAGRHRQDGSFVRSEGEGENEMEDQKTWENWWSMKEKSWVENEWEELSGDDLDGRDSGQSLRQEQSEEMRNLMGRSWR